MARRYSDVYNNILKIAPADLAEALRNPTGYWPKEGSWYMLSKYVHQYVPQCSTDENSVAIYAELCDVSPEEMKARFQERGL